MHSDHKLNVCLFKYKMFHHSLIQAEQYSVFKVYPRAAVYYAY